MRFPVQCLEESRKKTWTLTPMSWSISNTSLDAGRSNLDSLNSENTSLCRASYDLKNKLKNGEVGGGGRRGGCVSVIDVSVLCGVWAP